MGRHVRMTSLAAAIFVYGLRPFVMGAPTLLTTLNQCHKMAASPRASPIPHSLLTRQSSMLMEEDIERSVSPTTIQTR